MHNVLLSHLLPGLIMKEFHPASGMTLMTGWSFNSILPHDKPVTKAPVCLSGLGTNVLTK